MVKVIVVGAGFMGVLHARTVPDLRLATLAAVVDRDEVVAEAAVRSAALLEKASTVWRLS